MNRALKTSLVCLLTLSAQAALAKERIRFDCELKLVGKSKELEEFVLRPNESTQQFVTPERKFFIDLKEVQIAVEEEQPAPPAAPGQPAPPPPPPIIKQEPGLRLILWVYSDFTAKYESTETLLAKELTDEPLAVRRMEVVAPAGAKAGTKEDYQLVCNRLDKVTIPKIVIPDVHKRPKKKKLPTQKEIDEI